MSEVSHSRPRRATSKLGHVRYAADTVAKVFLGGQTKFFRAADAFCERRRERPHRFIQNRPGTSVVALKSDTAAEKSKDELSREFPGRSIFDFCNSIPPKVEVGGVRLRTSDCGCFVFFVSTTRHDLNASSDNGPCSAMASSHGARIRTSRSSSVRRMTGMALG